MAFSMGASSLVQGGARADAVPVLSGQRQLWRSSTSAVKCSSFRRCGCPGMASWMPRTRAHIGPNRSKNGGVRSTPAQTKSVLATWGPTPVEIAPKLAEVGPIPDEIATKLGRLRAKIGPCWSSAARTCRASVQNRSTPGQTRPNSTQVAPTAGRCRTQAGSTQSRVVRISATE